MKAKQIKNALIMIILSVALVAGIAVITKKQPANYADGIYYAVSSGNADGLWVKVEISANSIISVEVVEHNETLGISDPAIAEIPGKIVESQSFAVSAVSGATKTSNGIKAAVQSALEQASGEAEIVSYTPVVKEDPTPLGYTYTAGTYTLKEAVECWSDTVYEWNADVTVVLSEEGIESITLSNKEGEPIDLVEQNMIPDMIKWQTYDVDTISGATYSSNGLKDAVKQIVETNKKQ